MAGSNDTILQRAKDRREGRVRNRRRTPHEAQPIPVIPDPIKEAVLKKEILLEDFPLSEHMDDVFTQYADTSWIEAGPEDINAAKAAAAGERYVSPADVKRMEREAREDPKIAERIAKLESDARKARGERAGETPVQVSPLPPRGSDLHDRTKADEKQFEGTSPAQPEDVARVFGEIKPQDFAQVGHDLPPNAGDQRATILYPKD